jgi:hypothetical protein
MATRQDPTLNRTTAAVSAHPPGSDPRTLTDPPKTAATTAATSRTLLPRMRSPPSRDNRMRRSFSDERRAGDDVADAAIDLAQ